ncbi:MAG: hypothetical protein ACRDGV_09145 [Candidatus Limnocylindria bacterium]
MKRPAAGWSSLPLHPLLVAAYPVLFLFALNADDQVTLQPLWIPLAAAVGAAAVAFGLLLVILRDPLRAALVTTLLAALFFAYGHAWNLAGGWLGSQAPMLVAWAITAVVGIYLIVRSGRWALRATRVLNVVAALAVTLNLVGLGIYIADAVTPAGIAGPVGRVGAAAGEVPAHRPDIYYIVLDRYASAKALDETYGFDNSAFYAALEERGFYVAAQSHANYIKTPLSLVSTLDMDYLNGEALRASASSGGDNGPIHRALRGRLVVPSWLKELGYEYIQVANWWEPTRDNVDADRVFRYEGQTEFTAALLQTTLVRAWAEPSEPGDPWSWPVLRAHSEYELDRLEEIPSLPGPKFVFAHLLLPHDPYVFDVDGSFMDREQVAEQGHPESYLRQLQFISGRILDIIDGIIEDSGPDSIILLQSDEGPFPARYRSDEMDFDWLHEASDAELEEKLGILNAYRLPGVDPEQAGLTQSISPVNSFRIVFGEYFAADLPLLPDRIYAHRSNNRFYDFFEVTHRLRATAAPG